MSPKYSLVEIERRWFVDTTKLPSLEGESFSDIEDRYILATRTRLRKVVTPGKEPIYKLCKKYGTTGPFTEPITNIYLTPTEHGVYASLGARVVTKRRYRIAGGVLDVFTDGTDPRFEVEFASLEEASSYQPPEFVTEELVTSSCMSST